jgi:tetratricopeptide (TPR) repeat protein
MIAISYRREDSLPTAGRLYDRLHSKFGKKNVFMDFDSIPPGMDFREQIKQMIERSNLVIAIIGPHCLGEQPDASRRIDNPADFVRLEIAYALERGIPVIPVLVNNTPMPPPEKLPQEIEGLAFRNAVTLDTGIDFHHHADRLITGIGKAMDVTPRSRGPRKVPEPTASAANARPLRKIVIWSAAILLAITASALVVWYIATHRREPAKQVATANESKSDKTAQRFSDLAPTVKPSASVAPTVQPSSPLPSASVQPNPVVEPSFQLPTSASPNDTGHTQRGITLAQQGQYDEAIDEFTKAIDANVKDPGGYINRGIANRASGRFEDAIADFTKAINAAPDDEIAYRERGNTRIMQQRFDVALQDLDKAIHLNPDDGYAYKFRGFAQIGLTQWDKAVADFTIAIQREPDDWQNYDRRAWANRNLKYYAAAVADYTALIKKDPSDAERLVKRGATYTAMGQYEKAIADYKAALKLRPRDDATIKRLQYAREMLAARNTTPK